MSALDELAAMLREGIERYACDHYGPEARAGFIASSNGFSQQTWHDYAELGWLALRLPESVGGIEADPGAVAAVMEMVGRRLLMEPLLASAILGTGLILRLANDEQRTRWLPKLADGSLILACTDPRVSAAAPQLRGDHLEGAVDAVLHGDAANLVFVFAREANGAALVPVLLDASTGCIERRNYRLVDGRGAASLRFNNAPVERLQSDGSKRAVAAFLEEADLALCAEAVGCMDSLLDATVKYLKVRKQFGVTIGSHQALQHRIVDCYLLLEQARALADAARGAVITAASERGRLLSGARAFISIAARRLGNEAVQMHGGIGVTEELEISHHFRRLMVNRALFGDRDWQFERFKECA